MNAAAEAHPAPRARTRVMAAIAGGILILFIILLLIGVVARIRTDRELKTAAQSVQTAMQQVAVIRANPAADADLSLAGTTQAIKDSIIYARTSGYLKKRYVDIGDQVKAGELLAEIASPEVDQQLQQGKADLNQSQKQLQLQQANLDLARVTMARYQAADAENAVAKEAVDQSVATARTAQAAVAAAEATVASNVANVRRLEELTSWERVVAPFAGSVIQPHVQRRPL